MDSISLFRVPSIMYPCTLTLIADRLSLQRRPPVMDNYSGIALIKSVKMALFGVPYIVWIAGSWRFHALHASAYPTAGHFFDRLKTLGRLCAVCLLNDHDLIFAVTATLRPAGWLYASRFGYINPVAPKGLSCRDFRTIIGADASSAGRVRCWAYFLAACCCVVKPRGGTGISSSATGNLWLGHPAGRTLATCSSDGCERRLMPAFCASPKPYPLLLLIAFASGQTLSLFLHTTISWNPPAYGIGLMALAMTFRHQSPQHRLVGRFGSGLVACVMARCATTIGRWVIITRVPLRLGLGAFNGLLITKPSCPPLPSRSARSRSIAALAQKLLGMIRPPTFRLVADLGYAKNP